MMRRATCSSSWMITLHRTAERVCRKAGVKWDRGKFAEWSMPARQRTFPSARETKPWCTTPLASSAVLIPASTGKHALCKLIHNLLHTSYVQPYVARSWGLFFFGDTPMFLSHIISPASLPYSSSLFISPIFLSPSLLSYSSLLVISHIPLFCSSPLFISPIHISYSSPQFLSHIHLPDSSPYTSPHIYLPYSSLLLLYPIHLPYSSPLLFSHIPLCCSYPLLLSPITLT